MDVPFLLLFQSPLHSRKKKGQRSCCDLEKTLQALVEGDGEGWTEELRRDLPRSFQRHGDLVLLGDNCFTLPQWKKCGTALKPVTLNIVFSVGWTH